MKPIYKLFLALLLWSILAGALGCSPEDMPANKPASPSALRCGTVTHKFFANPPADTTLANRTYYVQFVPDTTCPPNNVGCWVVVNVQVPKAVYDTMLLNAAASTRYCYQP